MCVCVFMCAIAPSSTVAKLSFRWYKSRKNDTASCVHVCVCVSRGSQKVGSRRSNVCV